MATKNSITFIVSPKQIELARTKLAEKGFNIEGNSGAIKHRGCEVTYLYTPDLNELTLVLVRKPFFISVDTIHDALLEAIAPYGIIEKKG